MQKKNQDISTIFLLLLISFAFVITITKIASAQSSLIYSNITVKDGLLSDNVFSITQDSAGFIWFAMNTGLFRYDGYEVIPFKNNRSDTVNFSDNHLNDIINGSGNDLWAGGSTGLLHFDTSTGENSKIDLGGNREVRCLLLQGDSILWVGTAEGLFKLNILDESFELYNTQNSNLSSDIIRSLYLSNSDDLWVGTFNGLNKLLQGKVTKIYNFKKNYKPDLKNNLILDIKPYSVDCDSLLWIGSETGLVLFNTRNASYKLFNTQNTDILNEVVKCVHSKIPGEVYFGTDLGFYKYDVIKNEISSSFHDPFNQYSITNNVVNDIFEDNVGILWMATTNGVSKLNFSEKQFQFTPVYLQYEDQIVGTQVNDIYKDKDGSVWLATKHGVKVIKADGNTQEFTAESEPDKRIIFNNVSAISNDIMGRIWIGTAGGINVWDIEKQKMYTITANFKDDTGLRTNYISSFITPYDGSLWVTTWGGGIYKAEGDFSKIEDVSLRFVADFNSGVYSANKKIWIYEDRKIFAFDIMTNEIKTFDVLNEQIRDKRISSMHISKRGELWMGSYNELFKYQIESKKITRFQIHTGETKMLGNLVEDHNGNIWGTALTSIFKFDTRKNIFEIYPNNEGIALDHFFTNSNEVGEDGELFFGGDDGFVSFYADDIKKSEFKPNLLMTGLLVRGKDIHSLNEIGNKNKTSKQISFFDKIILDYNQNSFELQFSSLHFANPKRNIYAYKLEGFDNDWIYTTGDRNYASYTNIKPGDYTFILKGTNNDGVWKENQTLLGIVIKPPLWASPLFSVLYFVLLVLIIFALIHYYSTRSRMQNELRIIQLEKEHSENIAQTRQQFFTNISHEFRTPLSLIIGPAEKLAKNTNLDKTVKRLIQIIENNARRLLWLNNQFLDFRKLENNSLNLRISEFEIIEFTRKVYHLFSDKAEERRITYTFQTNIETLDVKMDLRKIETVLFNLLSNAFKFTPEGGEIAIKVVRYDNGQDSSLGISVKDSGIGVSEEDQQKIFKRYFQAKEAIKMERGSGIGLTLVYEYIKMHQGNIVLKSELGKGAEFQVNLPLGINYPTHDLISAETIKNEPLLKSKKRIEIENQIIHSALRNPSILLVEDDKEISEFIQISFKDKYLVDIASNGRIAAEMISQYIPDLVISDISMPVMDGLEFTKKFKNNPKTAHIPLILLTGQSDKEKQLEGLKSGADAYMIKPFEIDLLAVRIENLLKGHDKYVEYVKLKNITKPQNLQITSQDEKLLKKVVVCIENNISDSELTIEKICKETGVSHSTLYRKVKSLTGNNANELIKTVRVKRAEQLLCTKKYSVAEVMFETGFSNHSYFSKCFRKVYGMSPKEYMMKI